MEIWKDIPGYIGNYQISNLGRIKNLNWHNSHKAKIVELKPDKSGYVRLRIKKEKTLKIHRLVATAFIPNPDGLPLINHKNENKADNRVENLEWCDAKYNVTYNGNSQRIGDKLRNGPCSKMVAMVDSKTGIIMRVFPSAMEIERYYGYDRSNINKCCRNERKQAYGYVWKYY